MKPLMELTMRVANFLEGLVYLIGFVLVFMVVLVSRSAPRAPMPQLVRARVRKRTLPRSRSQ
jgi:hypothetical protein